MCDSTAPCIAVFNHTHTAFVLELQQSTGKSRSEFSSMRPFSEKHAYVTIHQAAFLPRSQPFGDFLYSTVTAALRGWLGGRLCVWYPSMPVSPIASGQTQGWEGGVGRCGLCEQQQQQPIPLSSFWVPGTELPRGYSSLSA